VAAISLAESNLLAPGGFSVRCKAVYHPKLSATVAGQGKRPDRHYLTACFRNKI
jgi:hypothetical protein